MEIDIGQNDTLNKGVSREIDNECFGLIDPLTTELAAYSHREFEVTFFLIFFITIRCLVKKGRHLTVGVETRSTRTFLPCIISSTALVPIKLELQLYTSKTFSSLESRVTYAAPFSLGCLLHLHHLLVKSTFVAHPDAHRLLPSTLVFEGSCFGNSRQLHIE